MKPNVKKRVKPGKKYSVKFNEEEMKNIIIAANKVNEPVNEFVKSSAMIDADILSNALDII